MRLLGEFGKAVEEVHDETNPEPERSGFVLAGETFFVDTDMGFVPFGKFAHAASSGLDSADMEGAAAIMDMMRDCIGDNPETKKDKDSEWARFQQVATQAKVKIDVILEIVGAVFSGKADAPSEQPSGSPNGSSKTATSASLSTKSSASRVSGKRPAKSTVTLKPEFEPVTDEVLAGLGG